MDTVRTWRKRFAEPGMPGLVDRKRTGRPPSVPGARRQEGRVRAPATTGLPGHTAPPGSSGGAVLAE
ncbi:helix-turn-helix domain-containing protein [Actinacidiphila soli]|uniref:helix-turn-helix domain-containing protein n=1 Tax=Actinacidiphila soli TaxID=2487275 RepID=UPI002AFEBBBD|nr:helix-turn-helix domain-containing protein [Actinacidiphila soli]